MRIYLTVLNVLILFTSSFSYSATIIEKVELGTPVAGARAEIVWVLDNSNDSDRVVRGVKKNIHTLFSIFNEAKVHFSSALISSSIKKFDGLFTSGASGEYLTTWMHPTPEQDFNYRVDKAYDDTFNPVSAPLWALFRFTQRAESNPEVFKQNFLLSGLPLEIVLMTAQIDAYSSFAKNTAQKNWNAVDYANYFIGKNTKDHKPFRIHAIVPSYINNSMEPITTGKPYKSLVEKTKGNCYGCPENSIANLDYAKVMEDLSEKIAFRASVVAKSNIKLTKVPTDISDIKVILRSAELTGNTGTEMDQWVYDQHLNQVQIYWSRIGLETIKPKDQLEVHYSIE